jgi:flagellar biosynthesis regulator FlaF
MRESMDVLLENLANLAQLSGNVLQITIDNTQSYSATLVIGKHTYYANKMDTENLSSALMTLSIYVGKEMNETQKNNTEDTQAIG